jgi:hypothetical protein
MGDRVITTQVRIDGDIVPDFSGWELRFKGERFVLPSDNPQASKDNTTRNSIVDLQFQSWAIQELKRYYFFEAASVSAGVAIADKYIAPVRLNVEDFVALLNQVLQYYFGGKIVADLYLSGTGIYSQEPKAIDINYSYLWDVIGKIFEIYGVRNRIEYDASSDVYTIKINYPAPEISDHDFEYGYQGGLLKFERQVQDESLSNILLGRGGTKNLPYRYFKKVDPQNQEWAADPDAIPELASIYFDRLHDINFRWYVRGWMHNPNRDTSGDEAWDPGHVFPTYEISSDSPHYWAYQKGLTDETFSPVEYVKDDDSIAAYGEHWGALDDNDDVYPTIQGRSRSGIGRIDEVVAVSPIITDDIDAMSEAASIEKSIDSLVVSVYANNRTQFEIESKQFTIPAGSVGNITYTPLSNETVFPNFVKYDTENTRLVAVPISGGAEIPATGIPAGTYRLKLYLVLSVESPASVATGDFGIENIVLTMTAQDENAWKPTFDIWVKDIWGTSRQQGETDEQYSERVWGPILGDRAGNEAKVAFSTGFMASSSDYEFVIASYPVPDTSKSIGGVQSAWRITLRKSDAEFDATGLYIPNATTGGKPVAGDKFFFTGIDMPHAYVEMGEEELSTVKSGELQGTATVNPTWIISLDKVRVNTLEAGEFGQTLADRLAAGAKLRVTDPRFSGGDVLILHAQSITYTWNEPTDDSPYIVPDIEVVLSDKVVSRESRQDKIESSVEQIKAQYARLDAVESVVRMVAEPLFLKKTGESDSSASPTQFSSKVSSKGFRQGGVGGSGWGFYKDNTDELAEGEIGDGDTVLEVDRMVVRKGLQVNSLVVNQVEYRGGMEVISAAKIEISKVIETNTRYICYFDQRKNSIANNFQVGDIAYGQVFTPQNATLRYYKCKVEAVDIDRVELSKTVKDGSGVPQAGDIIVQYGSYTDAARQYVIVRDVIGGGYERMISGLNAVDAPGAEYYFAGRQSGNGPRWFVGGHGANDDYAEFVNGVLTIKANVVFKPGQQIPGLEDYEYLKTALPLDEDATLVSGGLILSKTIALTDAQGNIKAGINGLATLGDIAAWYGGPMVDHEAIPAASAFAKSLFRFDGSGYLAGGNIHWGSDGYGGIPGVTWSREDGQDVVTIGGNVKLASVSGDTVTDLLTAIQQLPTTYVDFVSNQTITGVKTFTNGIKIGDATLTWVPGAAGAPGHLHIDQALVTEGDQIVIAGEPGGGGGGGVSWLSELMDVKKNLAPSVNDILVWRSNVSRNDGTTAPGWTNMTKSTFLSGYATQTWVTGQINDILSSVLKFQGTTTTAIADGSTTNPITIDGASYTAQKGDVVLYDGKEYLWQGSSWEQLGDESSWALKTTKIQAGTGLTGGGTLAANRTISLSSASIASLALADTAYQKPSSGIPATDLASAVQTNITNGATAYSYFTNGVANSAARLSGNTAYSVWGVEFWANGVPKSATARPNLYVGNTKVATSAQTAMSIGGLGTLTLANGSGIRFADNPAEGATAQNLTALQFATTNKLLIGFDTSTAGAETILYGNEITLRYGTGHTNGMIINSTAITAYRDIIPSSSGSRNLGSSTALWKYAYAQRLYLTSSIYIEYVDNSGNGYVHINAPLVTDGDQIVVSGTPGGGSGGVNWLYELQDVDPTLSSPTGGMVLQYDATSHLWKGAASDTIGITTAGTVAELNAATPTTEKRVWSPSVLASWLAGKNYITGADAVSNVAVGGTGHTNELAITKNGSTSYITVPYANTVKRFKRYAGTDEVGGYDLNTLLSGGGITSQYNGSSRWANRPDSMSFGGVLQINPNTNNNLSMQLAWDVVDNRTQEIYKTGKMWWRDYNAITGWGSWHIIYDNTTLLLNGAEGTDTPLTFFAPTGAGNAGQVLLSGGAGVAPAWSSAALGAANKPVYINASGVLTEGSTCVTLAGAQTITGAKTHSANITLNNAVGLYCEDTNDASVEAVSMSTSNTLRFGYGNRLAGTTGLFGKTFRIGTTDTAAGPDIYIGGLSSTHNTDAANIYFHSTLASGAVRNGVKVAAEHVASADRLNLSVYTSNNATSPYAPSWNKTLEVTYDGKVNIGAPSFSDGALNVNGAIVSAGDQVIASDERIKRNFKPIELSVEQIASCRAVSFDWASGGHSFGSVAQDWEPMVPEAVKQGDIKTLAYGQLALVAAINIAKHETEQDEEIRRLRERVADLEKEVKRLRTN